MRKTKEELLKMDAVEVYKMVLKNEIISEFPDGFWKRKESKEDAKKCTIFLIEEILGYSEDLLRECDLISLFASNGLGEMLINCFKCNPYEAIDNAYPNKFKDLKYKNVLRGYWSNIENGIEATRWLVEEKLNLSDEELRNKVSKELFKENGLNSMLQNCFEGSPHKAINAAYPGKFKEWEYMCAPKGYWDNKDNGIKAIKWLIEEKLNLSDEEIKEKVTVKLFLNNGLDGMLKQCFNHSPYEAINAAYPNKYKEWEFKTVPMKYWSNKENGIKATKWLIENKLKLSDKEIREQVSKKLFSENGLEGMLKQCFKNSPYDAINCIYPNRYKEWEFKYVPKGYWSNKENGIKATKWLVEEKLKLKEDELNQNVSQQTFKDYGLGGMLKQCFNNSPCKAMNITYPDRYFKK